MDHRIIHYFITKYKYKSSILNLEIYEKLYNMKTASIRRGYEYVKIFKTNLIKAIRMKTIKNLNTYN